MKPFMSGCRVGNRSLEKGPIKLELDLLLNMFPLTAALFYRFNLKQAAFMEEGSLEAFTAAKKKANQYIILALIPFIIPELGQFKWLHDSLVWIGTAAWLMLAKMVIWVGAPKIAPALPWLSVWQIRVLGLILLLGYARENLF